MTIKKQNVAWLEWSLNVDCPACEASVDLADQDDDFYFSNAIFNNKWDAIKGMDAYCPMCLHEFKIDSVEY